MTGLETLTGDVEGLLEGEFLGVLSSGKSIYLVQTFRLLIFHSKHFKTAKFAQVDLDTVVKEESALQVKEHTFQCFCLVGRIFSRQKSIKKPWFRLHVLL